MSQREQFDDWFKTKHGGWTASGHWNGLAQWDAYQAGAVSRDAYIERLRAQAQHESDCLEAAKAEIERLRADAERYRRLRDTKALRIDYYGEELDRYLDEQSLWDQRAANSINGDTNG